MKKNLSKRAFVLEFNAYNRRDNFSEEGREALYDYCTEFEEDSGVQWEVDIIAFCCEYTEFDDLEDFNDNYGTEFEGLDEVRYHTTVIEIPGTERFIIRDY